MITDRTGAELDETTALQQIVTALDRRFPDHNTPGDRLGRLLEELGELMEVVDHIECPHDNKQDDNNEQDGDPMIGLAKELQDVLRAVAGIAYHYGLPVVLTELMTTTDDRELVPERTDPYVQLAHLAKCGGVVAKAVHHAVGMGIKRHKHGHTVDSAWLTGAVYDVMRRVVQLAEHYGLRPFLRDCIEADYRRYQHAGYLITEDDADTNTAATTDV